MSKANNIVDKPKFVDVMINDRWKIKLPEHIADLPMWKFWEKERLSAMYSAIRPTDTILDIGTCNGDLSALFASWVPDGNIILVEPSPDFWGLIKAIFDKNNLKPKRCLPVLISNKTDDLWTQWRLKESDIFPYPMEAHNPIKYETGFAHLNEKPKIPTVRVDDLDIYNQENGIGVNKIDIITIDIEGSEYEAVEGASRVIRRDKPTIFISVHPEFMWREHHHSPDDLHVMLKNWGYEATYLAFDHEQHWMYKPIEKGEEV